MPTQPPEPLSQAAFERAFTVSRETSDRLARYVALLEKWNRTINLVGRTTLTDPWRRHILDCAQLSPHLERSETIADLGSGAGLPGLVLSLLHPEKNFLLIESDQRKSAFIREAARALKTNITLHTQRIEDSMGILRDSDTFVARALAPVPDLLNYIEPMLNEKKLCIFLKSDGINNELELAAERWDIASHLFPSVTDPRGRILVLEAQNRDQRDSG